jgi:hypothetical protein
MEIFASEKILHRFPLYKKHSASRQQSQVLSHLSPRVSASKTLYGCELDLFGRLLFNDWDGQFSSNMPESPSGQAYYIKFILSRIVKMHLYLWNVSISKYLVTKYYVLLLSCYDVLINIS